MKRPSWPSVGSAEAALALCVLAALPVCAQEEDDDEPDEIVVTARYREELLQETPIAISAFTAPELEARAFDTAFEIGYTVPNASLRPAQAAYGNTMTAFIRGIGQYDFVPEFEPGVGIYFDDVLHPVTMGSMVDLMDLERVEVLRGPQGTLFGRGSIGGAIRYVSKRPEGDNTGTVSLTTGSFDRVDVRASYDVALSENVFARFSGVSKSRDGFQKVYDFACVHPDLAGNLPVQVPNRLTGCQIGTQGGEDVLGARAQFRWVPADNIDLNFSIDHQDDSSEAAADRLISLTPRVTDLDAPRTAFDNWSQFYVEPTYGVAFDQRFVPTNNKTTYATYADLRSGLAFEPVTALQQTGASAKLDWQFADDIGVVAILGYRDFESKFATDADQSPLNEQTVDGRQDFDAKTAEIRFNGIAADGRLEWTAGAFRYEGSFKTGQSVSLPALIFNGVFTGAVLDPEAGPGEPGSSLSNPLIPLADAAAIAASVIDGPARLLVNGLTVNDSTNNSVFGHIVYDFNDRLSINGGVRYSEDDKDEDFDNNIVITSVSSSNSRTDYRVGVDYQLENDSLLYASVATGYRPQSFNPRPFQVTQFVAVDAEEATSYEVGFKSDFLERRLRMNLAAFYIDYNKRITPVGGTECVLASIDPPVYDTVPPGTPGAVLDSLGNTCLTTTSRTFYQNIPGEIDGVEVEMTYRPTDNLMLTGAYGFTGWSSQDLDDPGSVFGRNPDTGAPLINIVIDHPIFVPESNWNLSLNYDIGLESGGLLTPRIDVYGQTEICSQSTSLRSCADGYELTNVRLEWQNPSREWSMAVGLLNATDEEYYLNIFDLTAFGQPTTEGQPGAPRQWYMEFTRSF